MQTSQRLSKQQWVTQIAQQELPAITSMATTLDKFANDDVSSIPQLSQTIMHDQALSSCLLKVANTINYASVNRVNTVSRAAIVLGIKAVKNICLTSKILDALLESKNLKPDVYERLLMLMANAFYAGLLARMMLPEHHEDTKEEVYLAAMLYHIGETAFWSSGSPLCDQLIRQANALSTSEFQQYCREEAGIHFTELSSGLAQTWHLGELLIKALDEPQCRTLEMKVIDLSNKLSTAIHTPPSDKAGFNALLQHIARLMNIDIRQLKERIKLTRELALKMLHSYGADVLQKHIRALPVDADFVYLSIPAKPQGRDSALLQLMQQLQQLSFRKCNISELLSLFLKQCAAVFPFDSCAFWILTTDKLKMESRSAYDDKGAVTSSRRVINLMPGNNLFQLTVTQASPILVNQESLAQWRQHIDAQTELLLAKSNMLLAPVKIQGKLIGLVTAQRHNARDAIADEEYRQFCFLTEHLSMCLSQNSSR
ncbi:HDOD domain-containing protein [Rheinheimera fenheensis]|uniref:HDOD domain-containing protein n=1 Tax=Rheinheimera fenheensis TaxID=3152295 RepID=UPI00325F7C59